MTEVAEVVTAPEPVAAAGPPAPAPETPAAAAPDDVASLPEWAQKLIGKTRTEAATNRTKAGTANDALTATRDAIAKALGLKDDDDPVAAAKTAADERDADSLEAKATKVENAVLRAAGKLGADPESLTDSRSFMRALEAIDPAANDFATQVGEAIKAALTANPNLKAAAATAAPARSGGPVGGGAPVAGQLGREDLKGMTPEAIEKARVDGRLDAIQGIEK